MFKKIFLMLGVLCLLLFSGCVASSSNPTYEDEAIIGIDFPHFKTHTGDHFYKKDYIALSNGATLDILLITTDNAPHFLSFFVGNDAGINVTLYQSTTISNNGTELLYFNSNFNYNDTNGIKIYRDPTITNLGTFKGKNYVGSGRKLGDEIRADDEIILKPNTTYLYRITNQGVISNNVDYGFYWYDDIE